MKIVFFGTPLFSAQVLEYLMDRNYEVVAVVTRPDRPKGRSQKMQASAVKVLCLEKYPQIPLFQPSKASEESFIDVLRALESDIFVVVAYGEIMRQNLLDVPNILPINIHASLLPKYRGAAPIHRAIMNGEKETGITIIEMVLKMDAGPMLGVAKAKVGGEMSFGELEQILCNLAGPAVVNVIEKIKSGNLKKEEQDESQVTFADKILLEDRAIAWKRPAYEVHNQIRGLSPSPGAFCWIEQNGKKKRLGIKKTKEVSNLSGSPGETLLYGKGTWVVGCGRGALALLQVQMEGKNVLDIDSFLLGHSAPPNLTID